MKFPKHEASMTITHNDHTSYYQTIEEYLNEDFFTDETKEAKQKCIDAGEIWELQWYPQTPIGFHRVIGPSLEKCVEKALEEESK